MYTDEDLQSAVRAGVLPPESAEAFRAHVAGLRNAPLVDEENFRLVTSFNDIFVAIACLLVLGSAAALFALTVPLLASISVAVISLGLAWPFTRRRRMALPSILLTFGFVGGIVGFLTHLAMTLDLEGPFSFSFAAFAAGGLASWLHWKLFRVPISVAMGVGCTLMAFTSGLLTVAPSTLFNISPWVFLCGVAAFALALRWDAMDPLRRTRKSDAAFWIHLLAAPLLLYPIFALLNVFETATASVSKALAVLGIYLFLALVSLVVDRRALMASSLAYVLVAFTVILKQKGLADTAFMVVGIVLGSALLVLSAYWHKARVRVFRYLPAVIRDRVTPLRDAG